MKNYTTLSSKKILPALLLMLIALVSCSSNPQKAGPTETAKAFLSELKSGDYEGAKDFCSESTKDKLNMFKSLSKMGANPFSEPFEVLREENSGDYANVFYSQGDKNAEKVIKLRNTTGKWEVLASKSDMTVDNDGLDSDLELLDGEVVDATEEVVGGLAKGLSEGLGKMTEGFGKLGNEIGEAKNAGGDSGVLYADARNGKNASETALAFLTALKFNDTDGAKKYASKKTADNLAFQTNTKSDKYDGLKITGEEKEGDYATVFYSTDAQPDGQEIKLGKDSQGNWEVIMTKKEFE